MAGTIGNVIVSWTVDTPDGPRSGAIDLAAMRRNCRAERIQDLLEGLELLGEDVTAARQAAGPALRVVPR
jgi:hypothetical protein